MNFPGVNQTREGRLALDALRRGPPFIGGKDAHDIFSGETVVATHVRSIFLHKRHRSRHSFSFIRLRRSQVLIVFSGTL